MPPASKLKGASASTAAANGTVDASGVPAHETRGAIVRVSMKNFVTYKDVEVRPGNTSCLLANHWP